MPLDWTLADTEIGTIVALGKQTLKENIRDEFGLVLGLHGGAESTEMTRSVLVPRPKPASSLFGELEDGVCTTQFCHFR